MKAAVTAMEAEKDVVSYQGQLNPILQKFIKQPVMILISRSRIELLALLVPSQRPPAMLFCHTLMSQCKESPHSDYPRLKDSCEALCPRSTVKNFVPFLECVVKGLY
jgi:hypothetical protein